MLPIDRTAKTALDGNLVNGNTSDAPAVKNSNDVVYNTIDELFNYTTGMYNTDKFTQLGILNVKDSAFKASGSTQTTTGSITTGTPTLTVASVIDFAIGQGINVAGAGAAGTTLITKINSISGTVLTLAANASTTVTSQAVNHDDTAAIQAAINAAANANSGGGVVWFPKGTYLISSTITIPLGIPIMLVGAGWSYDAGAATTIKCNAAVAMFTPANGANGICIRDMVLDGNNKGTYGWYGPYGNKARFENLLIQNFQTGIYSRQGLLTIKDNYIRNCTSYGLDINSDTWIYANEISVCGVGLRVVSGGCRITDNLINSCTSYGIILDGTFKPTDTVGWNHISGGYIGENGTANIYIVGDAGTRNARYNQISDTFIQQVTNIAALGISLLNTDFTTLSDVLYLGGIGGSAADTGGIKLNSAHNTQINDYLTYNSTNIPITLIASNDVAVNGLSSYNHGNATTNAYGITIDAACYRTRLNAVVITDTRSPGYSKGFSNAGNNTTLIDYRISTPAASPDSFGTAVCLRFNINTGKLEINGLSNLGANIAVTAAATNIVVNLGETYPDTNYVVLVMPNWNTTFWFTNKLAGQITVNFGTAAPANALIDLKAMR